MTLQLVDDVSPIRRVADQQKRKRLAIDQDIVDHATPVVGHQAILDLAVGQPGDLVGRDPLQPFQDARSVESQAAHVADVEPANRCRTAKCSSTIDVYCTGIDHPPKSTGDRRVIEAIDAEAFKRWCGDDTRASGWISERKSNWDAARTGLILSGRGRIGKSALSGGWRSAVEEDERSCVEELSASPMRPAGCRRYTNGGWASGGVGAPDVLGSTDCSTFGSRRSSG